jgi:hypothetical protein
MPRRYKPPYNSQELEIMSSGVELGIPLSELEKRLEDRSSRVIGNDLQKLSEEDPNNWNPEQIRRMIADSNSKLWRAPQNDPDKVQQSRQRILNYLRENYDADREDIYHAGLNYDFSVGYQGRINDARKDLGFEERASGGQQQLTKEQRRQRIVSFLRNNPNTQATDNPYNGFQHDRSVVDGSIEDLRREAGILPNGFISAAEVSNRLHTNKQQVTNLFKRGDLDGFRLGRHIYISEISVTNYSK